MWRIIETVDGWFAIKNKSRDDWDWICFGDTWYPMLEQALDHFDKIVGGEVAVIKVKYRYY